MECGIQGMLAAVAVTRPVSVDVRFSVVSVVRAMNARHANAALVYAKHELVGIFTERDILTRVVELCRDARATQVGEVMTPTPLTVRAQLSLDGAMHIMHENGFRHLPVLGERGPAEVVSMRDVANALARVLDIENRQLNEYISGAHAARRRYMVP